MRNRRFAKSLIAFAASICMMIPAMPASAATYEFRPGDDGKMYWYEDGVKQGTYDDVIGVLGDGTIRGREIYDSVSDGWYWLDSVYDGAKAVGKEVWIPYIYQDELIMSSDGLGRMANGISDEARIRELAQASSNYEADMSEQVEAAIRNRAGKWVRYDENGRMLKGWVVIEDALAVCYPDQAGNVYYYDRQTGLMAKGNVTINGVQYHFDEITGVLDSNNYPGNNTTTNNNNTETSNSNNNSSSNTNTNNNSNTNTNTNSNTNNSSNSNSNTSTNTNTNNSSSSNSNTSTNTNTNNSNSSNSNPSTNTNTNNSSSSNSNTSTNTNTNNNSGSNSNTSTNTNTNNSSSSNSNNNTNTNNNSNSNSNNNTNTNNNSSSNSNTNTSNNNNQNTNTNNSGTNNNNQNSNTNDSGTNNNNNQNSNTNDSGTNNNNNQNSNTNDSGTNNNNTQNNNSNDSGTNNNNQGDNNNNSGTNNSNNPGSNLTLNSAGYYVFGSYEQDGNTSNGKEPIEWNVVAENENGILIVSRYVLDVAKYNEESVHVTWETCTLRSWLNNDFYNSSFSDAERATIQTTHLVNGDNTFKSPAVDGGNDTDDKIFILSIDDAFNFYHLDYVINRNTPTKMAAFFQGLMAQATPYALGRGIGTGNISQDDYFYKYRGYGYTSDCINMNAAWYWMRNPGQTQAYAYMMGENGLISAANTCYNVTYGPDNEYYIGVRPALYIRN